MGLAACLEMDGRKVIAARTRSADAPTKVVPVILQHEDARVEVPVETIGLSRLPQLDGLVAVTAKAYANGDIARALRNRPCGPLVLLQNGLHVEEPFLEEHPAEIYRAVLYVSSDEISENQFRFHSIRSSPIGIVSGSREGLDAAVASLTTDQFPFHAEANLDREVWKKAIINAVFNSICPLLDTDNGVFVRSREIAELANLVVLECISLTQKLGLGLTGDELMQIIMQISESSDGELISTLHDMRAGRETEISYLNLEIARTGASQRPTIELPRTEMLGRMILEKSKNQMMARH